MSTCYPYDYMIGVDETELPARKHFFNRLSDLPVSDEDYTHAQNVWTFQIRKLGDYYNFYLKTDVLLLVDMFESFARHASCTIKSILIIFTPFWVSPGTRCKDDVCRTGAVERYRSASLC